MKQSTIELTDKGGFVQKTKRFDPDSGEALPDKIEWLTVDQVASRIAQLTQQIASCNAELERLQGMHKSMTSMQAEDIIKKQSQELERNSG
jgi:uncharacterized small protein (DUF1192 family)